jgi:hypothetical protein
VQYEPLSHIQEVALLKGHLIGIIMPLTQEQVGRGSQELVNITFCSATRLFLRRCLEYLKLASGFGTPRK